MKRFVLKNGMIVLLKQKPTSSVAVEVTVKIGSNYEPVKLGGISHFIEHLLFEGTKNRTAQQIANEVESLGGEINAFTNNERTSYYVLVLHKHFDKALNVLADMIQNPLFDDKVVEKERKVILDEISFTTDDPKAYQWILFQRLLFRKHPCRHPVYGTKKSVSGITRKDLIDFYSSHYAPNNMVISVVGNFDDKVVSKIEKAFTFHRKKVPEKRRFNEPRRTKPSTLVEKRKLLHSYIVIGYKVAPRGHPDSFVMDVIRSVLGRGQSSRLFDEIRTKRGLAYIVGSYYESGSDYGWFAVYVGTDKKNLVKVKRIVLNEFKHLKKISLDSLNDAKTFIEGDYLLSNEDTQTLADTMSAWELIGKISLVDDYLKKIKNVTRDDIKRVVGKYFKNPAYIVIKQS